MAALKALSHWRHGTQLFVCSYQRVWHPSSCVTLYMAAYDSTRRQYSGSGCLMRHSITDDSTRRQYSGSSCLLQHGTTDDITRRKYSGFSCLLRHGTTDDSTRKKYSGSSYLLRHGTTDDSTRKKYSGSSCLLWHSTSRHYSSLSVNRCTLQLQKSQNSALLMETSQRNFEFNLFYMLVELAEGQFIGVKDITGLDWWLVIVLCTIPYRIALAYFMRKKQVDMDYKVQHIQKTLLPSIQAVEMRDIMHSRENMHLKQREKHRIFTRVMSQHLKRLYKEQNCDPWKIFIYNLSPLPFWVANSWALQHLNGSSVSKFLNNDGILCPDMLTQGVLWFPNLCLADPYHILPVMCGLSFLIMSELYTVGSRNYGQKHKSNNLTSKVFGSTLTFFQYFTKAWTIFFVYIVWDRSSAMTFYWCISGLSALIGRIILLHPAIDRHFAPKNMHYLHDENPYRTIFKNMQNRYTPKNWFLGNK